MGNDSFPGLARPPLLPHDSTPFTRGLLPRYLRFALGNSRLDKRDFQCPAGTSNCASIDRPETCCPEGQTCQRVQDTGLGDVGCCPQGQTCGGSLSDCGQGYTSCPNFANRGCCIPGYACVTGGCVQVSTATVLVNPSASRTTTTSRSSPTSTPTPTAAPTSSTRPNTLVCTAGFRSCPASLGGGCCPSSRECGRQECPQSTTTIQGTSTSTGLIGPPVRPTSDAPQTTPSDDPSITGCPTGFYACSAVYQGGCCRHGRDCAATSCPTSVLTTLVDGSVATIVATATSGLSANLVPTGVCATGWSSCPASQMGGCCPSGYICGMSCTATATVSGSLAPNVAKLPPQNGASRGMGEIHRVHSVAAIFVILFLWAF